MRRAWSRWWSVVLVVVLVNVAIAAGWLATPRPRASVGRLPAPLSELPGIEVQPAVRAEVQRFVDDVNQALRRADLAVAEAFFADPDVVHFLRERVAQGSSLQLALRSIAVSFERGTVVDLCLIASQPPKVIVLPLASRWIDHSGTHAVLRAGSPSSAGPAPRVNKVRGTLRIDQRERRIEGDLVLEIEAQQRSMLMLTISTAWRDPLANSDRGLQWEEISQRGVPCKVTQLGTRLFVELPTPEPTVQLRFRFSGAPREDDDTYFGDDVAYMDELVPRLSHDTPAFEVQVYYRIDAEEAMLVSGSKVEQMGAVGDGWHLARVGSERATTLAVVVGALTRWGEISHSTFHVQVYGPAGHERHLEEARQRLVAALTRLAPLGVPARSAKLAFLHRHNATRYGEVRSGLILLGGPNSYESDYQHELAHLWFGEQVPGSTARTSRWWEGVAEYLGTLGLAAADARHWRRGRLAAYDDLDPDEDLPLLSEAPCTETTSDGLSYGKAMLLMQALEVRIGRDRVMRFLRALVERYAGQFADWPEVMQVLVAVETPEVASWFAEWLARPGAPALELQGGVIGDRFRGEVVQHLRADQLPFRGTVELVFEDPGERVLATHRIELSGEHTVLDLPLAEGASRLNLDPDLRFPRHRWMQVDGTNRRSMITAIELPAALP